MSKKRTFPDDWSKMSDVEIAENIKYLQKHYKTYNVRVSGNSIYLDNIHICTYAQPKDGCCFGVQTEAPWIIKNINDKEIRNDNLLYPEIQHLCKDCVNYTLLPLTQCKDWIKNNRNLLIITAFGLKIGLAIGVFVGYMAGKQSDIETKVQTSVQEYNTKQEKTINITDSIKRR